MSEIINISCPGCNTAFEVPDEMIGQTVECPQCGASFEIVQPGVEAGTEAEAETEAAGGVVNTACPGCNTTFEVPAEMVGESVECPQCNATFEIAALESAPTADQTSETEAPVAPPAEHQENGEYTHTVKMSRTSIGMVPVVDDSFNLGVVGQHIQKTDVRKAFESGEFFLKKDGEAPGEEAPAEAAVPKKKWWQFLLFWKK